MPITLTVTKGMQLVVIEDATVTVASEDRVVGNAVNGWLKCDGLDPISFTVTHTNGTDTQTFTLEAGEVCEEPFVFKKLAWVAASGANSAFRMRAYLL